MQKQCILERFLSLWGAWGGGIYLGQLEQNNNQWCGFGPIVPDPGDQKRPDPEPDSAGDPKRPDRTGSATLPIFQLSDDILIILLQ